jgi:hypothetical protein
VSIEEVGAVRGKKEGGEECKGKRRKGEKKKREEKNIWERERKVEQ